MKGELSASSTYLLLLKCILIYSDLFLRMYLSLEPVIIFFISELVSFYFFNCLELEKEIEELRSKAVAGGTDDIIKVMKQL